MHQSLVVLIELVNTHYTETYAKNLLCADNIVTIHVQFERAFFFNIKFCLF